jgi:hypothetical protein
MVCPVGGKDLCIMYIQIRADIREEEHQSAPHPEKETNNHAQL